MSRRYFSPSSRRDLIEILNYIAKDKPGAALRHIERLEEACWMLAKNPGMGIARDELLAGMRCWPVGNHVVFFRPAHDGVDIVRIVHGARDVGRLFE